MNSQSNWKKYAVLSTMLLFLVACGNQVDSDVEEGSVEPETEEVNTEEIDDEETNEGSGEETNTTEEETETAEENEVEELEEVTETAEEESDSLTEDEAIELVRLHVEEQEDLDIEEGMRWTVQEGDEGEYLVQLFTFAPEGEDEVQHTQTIGWYVVNKETHEVTNRMDEVSDVYISEIVSMSEESRENHLRNLTANEENLEAHVFDQLLLPGLHENTAEYEGRVNSGDQVRLVVSSTGATVEPEVDGEGYFLAELDELSLTEGEILSITISGENYSQDQTFELFVHPEHEGMESIRVRE